MRALFTAYQVAAYYTSFVVFAVLFYSIKTIIIARRTPARTDKETPYIALTPAQMADA